MLRNAFHGKTGIATFKIEVKFYKTNGGANSVYNCSLGIGIDDGQVCGDGVKNGTEQCDGVA